MQTEILISDLILIAKKNLFFLWEKKWLVALCSIFFGISTLLLFKFTPIKFHAELTLINENDNQNKLGTYANLADLAGIDLGNSSVNTFEGENLLELLVSRRMVDKVLLSSYKQNQFFFDAYIINHNIKWANNTHAETSRNKDSMLNEIGNKIIKKQLSSRKVDKKNDLIRIEFDDINEDFAYSFIHKLVETTTNYYIEYKTKKASDNVTVFQGQVDSVKNKLFSTITEGANDIDKSINLVKAKGKTQIQQNQINQQANAALYVELLKNLELSKIALLREKPFIQIIDSPKKPLLNNRLGYMQSFLLGFSIAFIAVCFLLLYKQNHL